MRPRQASPEQQAALQEEIAHLSNKRDELRAALAAVSRDPRTQIQALGIRVLLTGMTRDIRIRERALGHFMAGRFSVRDRKLAERAGDRRGSLEAAVERSKAHLRTLAGR